MLIPAPPVKIWSLSSKLSRKLPAESVTKSLSLYAAENILLEMFIKGDENIYGVELPEIFFDHNKFPSGEYLFNITLFIKTELLLKLLTK